MSLASLKRVRLWTSTVVLACAAAAAQADFQVNAVKTDQGAKDIVELYFFNDGANGTGTALEAYEVRYSGTPVQFPMLSDPREADVYNQGSDPSLSWMRVNSSIKFPFRLTPSIGDPAWEQAIGQFQVTYATLSTVPARANVGRGARFARLVLPDGGSFSVNGLVGGEVGTAGLVAYSANYFIANAAPVISGGGTVGGNTRTAPNELNGPLTRRVTATDTDGVLLSFVAEDLDQAVANGFTLQKVGLDAFDVTWNPSIVTPGIYDFRFTAVDSSIQANSTSVSLLQVVVVPEPATLVLASLGVLLRRRR